MIQNTKINPNKRPLCPEKKQSAHQKSLFVPKIRKADEQSLALSSAFQPAKQPQRQQIGSNKRKRRNASKIPANFFKKTLQILA